ACDFFIKENVAHGIENVRIETERKFADVTGASIGVQNFVQAAGVVGGGLDDFAVFEFETDVFKFRPGVKRGGVVLNVALHGIFHRTRKDFAVGNIAFALGKKRANAFNAKTKIGAR